MLSFDLLSYATEEYAVGDIVQIHPQAPNVGGCLLVVNDEKDGQLTGIISIPNTEPREGQEWAVPPEACVKVGTVEWLPFERPDDPEALVEALKVAEGIQRKREEDKWTR